jgi:hypothetical protein
MTSDALVPDRTRKSLVTGALRELAFAVQAMELYPSKSPVVLEAVKRARSGLIPLVQHGGLTLEVLSSSLVLDGREVGSGHEPIRKLAAKLHHRRVARLTLDPSMNDHSLLVLAQAAGTDRHELEGGGGVPGLLSQLRATGIRVELLELDRLFDSTGDAVDDEDVWDRMLHQFQDVTSELGAGWAELLENPERLTEFLEWILDHAGSEEELADYSTVDLLRQAIGRVGGAVPEADAEQLEPMGRSFSALYDQLSPEALIELLVEPLMLATGPAPYGPGPANVGGMADPADPVGGDAVAEGEVGQGEVGFADGDGGDAAAEPGMQEVDGAGSGEVGDVAGRGDRTPIDAMRVIARGLERPQVEDLIVYTIQTREPTSSRVVQLFARLLDERHDRGEIADAVGRAFQGGDSGAVGLASAWPNLHDVLLGEAPEPYVSQRYAATLERLEDGLVPGAALWALDRIQPRFGEMDPLFLLRRKSEILLSLLERETDATEYADLAIELEKALPEFVLHEEYALVERVFATLAGHRDPANGRPAAQREIASEVLARFCNRHTLLQLVRSLTGKPSHAVLTGIRIFTHLGAMAVPALLSALWQEKSRPGRLLLLKVLTSLGDDVVPEIEKHLEDERWFVVRNLVWIIRELGTPELVRPLSLTVRHPDARVRRESVLALGKIGGPEAAELLLTCVDDVDLETRLAAIRGVGLSGLRRAVPVLRPNLDLPNWHGRNSALLEVSIVALARLGDQPSIPQFRQHARRPLLFPQGRRVVRDAARWALQTLHAPDRHPWHERAARVRRRLESLVGSTPPGSPDTPGGRDGGDGGDGADR